MARARTPADAPSSGHRSVRDELAFNCAIAKHAVQSRDPTSAPASLHTQQWDAHQIALAETLPYPEWVKYSQAFAKVKMVKASVLDGSHESVRQQLGAMQEGAEAVDPQWRNIDPPASLKLG